MTGKEFEAFVGRVSCELERVSQTDPGRIATCKSGEDFEKCVVKACQVVVDAAYPGACVCYTAGSHAFPDIIVEFSGGDRYGIEVKSSSSATSRNWKINGNSVLGSTKEDVLDTYIIFGKTAKGHQAFRYKRYEDAVANVGVTHSPRYLIDLDVAPEETFFAKSGLSYQRISESANPIKLITNYFKSQGEQAWWLGEDSVAPAVIRIFSDLPSVEQDELVAYCFAHFPEVFSSSQKKFHRCAIWMATQRSVLSPSLRDAFSAGGRMDVVLEDETYPKLPRIFTTLHEHRRGIRAALSAVSDEELMGDWGLSQSKQSIITDRMREWARIGAGRIDRDPATWNANAKMLYAILMDK